mmetsp:Transcript_11929/g.25647  ORF Transcript_11929/g.25647 Transcript_11929/m.25647 type:complete len:343 (+) Transcript_11929:166-1194(+)
MSLSSSIFRRGGPKKELFNDGASVAVEADNQDEEGNLLATLQELDEVLNAPKIGKDFSAAIWRSEYNMAELVRVRKTTAQMNGVSWKGKQYLHIEEAVFFVDRGDLLLFVEVPVVPGAGQQQQQQQGVRDRHAGRGSARQQQQQEEGQQQQQGPAAAGEAAGSGRAGHQGHEPETGPPEPLHRCWWPAISARHGKLSGVPQSYFDELPRHQAFDSIGKQLRQAHPRLRCFGAIPDGPHLGECSPSGHVVFDVYRPGSRVARGKGQFPEPMYHLAICSGRPPTPQEMRQAESEVAAHHAAGAGQGGCGTTGGGPQPCPLMWASIEDSIITFLRLGTMELLQLV